MKNVDLVGANYCTKFDDFINTISEESKTTCSGNCEECKSLHTVTRMVNKIIIRNGDVIELDY